MEPGATWELVATCGHRPGHANDGPESAYLRAADGSIRPVRTGATALVRVARAEAPTYRPVDATARGRAVEPGTAGSIPTPRRCCRRRVSTSCTSTSIRRSGPTSTSCARTARTCACPPAPTTGLQRAITAHRRCARSGEPPRAGRHRPLHEWRGLHVDLARQFFPAADVAWLIDVAAWHGLNRLHLHLTDDEGWRVPVDGYPALTDVGAWRGAGLPIPAAARVRQRAVRRRLRARRDRAHGSAAADEAGVVVVPEVDLPGHCFAALAAYPELADPDDTSGAVSVQSFVDNVLNPGVPATRPFVEAVFGSLADLFPSPWLHIGGDELPHGAWRGLAGGAAVRRRARARLVARRSRSASSVT